MGFEIGARLSTGWTHLRLVYPSQEFFLSFLIWAANLVGQKSRIILCSPDQIRRFQLRVAGKSKLRDTERKKRKSSLREKVRR